MATNKGLTKAQLKKLQPKVLDDLQREMQWYFGRASLEIQRRREQKRLHMSAEEAQVGQGDFELHRIISPELGFDVYNFHIFHGGMRPRTERGRYHTHGDAVKYYLSGRGFELVGDKRFEVKRGDFMHIPANTWHGTQNPHDEPLRFLAWQQFPGTFRQTPTPFIYRDGPPDAPSVKDMSDEDLRQLDPRKLYLVYLKAQMEYGEVQVEVQRRRGQKRLHVPAEEAPLYEWGPGSHMIIAPEYGFDIYTFHIWLAARPPHTEEGRGHFHGDAVKWYLTGRGYEQVGDQRIDVKPGDFVHIPGYIWHRTVNTSDEIMRLLIVQQYPGTFRQVTNPWQPPGR